MYVIWLINTNHFTGSIDGKVHPVSGIILLYTAGSDYSSAREDLI